jgi:uncharacterized protein YbaP (TraB family)
MVAATALVALLFCGATATRKPPPPKATAAPANSANLFLWKVTPKDAPLGDAAHTVYLLGSVHVGAPSFYPLPKEIEQAFGASKKLVVEVNTEQAGLARVQQLLMTKGMYPAGESLADHVAPDTLTKFRAFCTKNNLPPEVLERFRPWASAMTVTMTDVEKQGFRADLGIDDHFMKAAKKLRKPVLELESAEAQIELLAGLDGELQEQFLLGTLDETGDGGKAMMDESMKAWKAGDADRLKELMIDRPNREFPKMKPVTAKLLDDRNGPMAEKVEGFLKAGDGPYFVVVGAGHLVGARGLVEVLAKKGFDVNQLRKGATIAQPKTANDKPRIQITPRRQPAGAP